MTSNKRIEVNGLESEMVIVEKPMYDVPPNGLILKTHFAGICHSDVHLWGGQFRLRGDTWVKNIDAFPGFKYPFVLGHEIAGEIYKIGDNYTGARKVGERVAVYPWLGCGDCCDCDGKQPLFCEVLFPFSLGCGQLQGGYQQYVAVRDVRFVCPVDASVPLDVACLFGCSALTAFNAVNRVKPAIDSAVQRAGKASLLVIGTGGLGLWAISWAKAILPKETKVFCADLSEDKLETGKEWGADEGILWDRQISDDDLVKLTKDKTGGGINGSMDFVGLPTTAYKAFDSCKTGAICASIGLAGGEAKIPIVTLNLANITYTGVQVGSEEQMQNLIKVFAEKQIKPPPITLVSPDQAEDSIRKLKAGQVFGRHVIDFVNFK